MKLKETDKAEIVIKAVINYYQTDEETIFSKTRKRGVVQLRQMCQYLLKMHTKLSFQEIANKTNLLSHANIMYAINTIQNLIDTDKLINKDYTQLNAIIKNEFLKKCNDLSELDVKKLDIITIIQSSSSESEIERKLLEHFNLNQDLTKMRHLKGRITVLEKKLARELHPTIKRALELPKNKLDDLIKYKIEPHLKMNA